MEDNSSSDPLALLLQAAGIQISGWEAVDPESLNAALNFIGTPPVLMESARQAVVNALTKHRIRLPKTGQQVPAKQIRDSLAAIEDGLRKLSYGLGSLARARQTTDPAIAPARAAELENAHRFVIGAICSAMPASFGISDEQVADSAPQYSRMGFSDQWRGRFVQAAGQVSRGKHAWDGAEFAMPTRTRKIERDELIVDLGGIFREITGDPPTAWRPAGNARANSRSKFQQFAEMLWPLTGEQDAPSAEVLQAALLSSRPLPPPGEE